MILTVSYGAYLPNEIDHETAFHFSENQTGTVCLFGRFYLLLVLASKRSPKQMQLSLILELAPDWFQICRFPDDLDFRVSGFPYFQVFSFPLYVSTRICPCSAGWIEGLFEVVALKTQFSDSKWNLLSCFLIKAISHLWTDVLSNYLARNVTQFSLFCVSDCYLAWDSIDLVTV